MAAPSSEPHERTENENGAIPSAERSDGVDSNGGYMHIGNNAAPNHVGRRHQLYVGNLTWASILRFFFILFFFIFPVLLPVSLALFCPSLSIVFITIEGIWAMGLGICQAHASQITNIDFFVRREKKTIIDNYSGQRIKISRMR